MEAKLLLTTILQYYLPLTAPGYRAELAALITLRPKNGLPVTLAPATTHGDATKWNQLLQVPPSRALVPAERQGCRGALMALFGFLRP